MTALEGKPAVVAAVGAPPEKKRVTAELGLAESVPELNAFIEADLDRHIEVAPEEPRTSSVVDLLNDIFHQSLYGHGSKTSQERA